jgi:hypothetical protein
MAACGTSPTPPPGRAGSVADADGRARLARDDLDALKISTPHALYREACERAARAGRPGRVPEPLATTVAGPESDGEPRAAEEPTATWRCRA